MQIEAEIKLLTECITDLDKTIDKLKQKIELVETNIDELQTKVQMLL